MIWGSADLGGSCLFESARLLQQHFWGDVHTMSCDAHGGCTVCCLTMMQGANMAMCDMCMPLNKHLDPIKPLAGGIYIANGHDWWVGSTIWTMIACSQTRVILSSADKDKILGIQLVYRHASGRACALLHQTMPVHVAVSLYNSDLESWAPGVAFELTGPDWQVIYASNCTHNMTMMWKD